MLISFVELWHDPDQRAVERYTRWRNALAKWRALFDPGDKRPLAAASTLIEELPQTDQAGALQDMLAWCLWSSWRHGLGLTLDDLADEWKSHPVAGDWAANPPLDLIEEEFLARHQQPHGIPPRLEEYARRFPNRADVAAALERRLADGGRYVRLARLGGGAMGEVWEAWDHQSHRMVALKQLAWDANATAEANDALSREFRMAARLSHPGIIRMLDFHDGEHPFFTMSLVSGDTLAERIRAFHQPPPDSTRQQRDGQWRELLGAFASVCDAAAAAHGQGVIHRDLKPANVLTGANGEVVVSDWALAKNLAEEDRFSASGLIAGTPEYMAPEQARGLADIRSDVFALGAILYEILTARPPRDSSPAAGSTALQQSARDQPIPPPSGLPQQASKRLAAVCMKALSTNPQDRPASARELGAEARRHADNSKRGLLGRIFRRHQAP